MNGTQAYFGRKQFFSHANTLNDIVEIIDFLIDNMFIEFCGLVLPTLNLLIGMNSYDAEFY